MKRLFLLIFLMCGCGGEESGVPVDTALGELLLVEGSECWEEIPEGLPEIARAEVGGKFVEAVAQAPWLAAGERAKWLGGVEVEFRPSPFDCGGTRAQGCFLARRRAIITGCDGASIGHESAHAMLWAFGSSCWREVEHSCDFTCECGSGGPE